MGSPEKCRLVLDPDLVKMRAGAPTPVRTSNLYICPCMTFSSTGQDQLSRSPWTGRRNRRSRGGGRAARTGGAHQGRDFNRIRHDFARSAAHAASWLSSATNPRNSPPGRSLIGTRTSEVPAEGKSERHSVLQPSGNAGGVTEVDGVVDVPRVSIEWTWRT